MSKEFVAAVLVRGTVNVRSDIKSALTTLKLLRKNACVVLPDTPANRGLMKKTKDYITYGPISKEFLSELQGRSLKRNGKPTNVFRLHPPRGGFKGSIKKAYQDGGVLGLRAESMEALIKRMI